MTEVSAWTAPIVKRLKITRLATTIWRRPPRGHSRASQAAESGMRATIAKACERFSGRRRSALELRILALFSTHVIASYFAGTLLLLGLATESVLVGGRDLASAVWALFWVPFCPLWMPAGPLLILAMYFLFDWYKLADFVPESAFGAAGYAIAAIVVFGFIRREAVRAARRDATCCTLCGYDLRATPRRCPECGTIPPGKIEKRVGGGR